ncbi:zinc-binding dehydrogenase [Ornithinibacillus salinisoli]|uniref:Zinc-binding dehydrogenase n=1 Tax=Ornithinibacillus salinisoli TaxID=1848459 RepID=A0ABW4VXS2_9BACI
MANRGGTLASIVSVQDEVKAKEKHIKAGFIWLNSNGEQLAKLADLLEQNQLKVTIGHRFPLSESWNNGSS